MMQNKKTKQLTAWIAAIAIIFVVLFSVIYISEHVDHECTGAECPICSEMVQCVNNINSVGTIIAVVVAAFFLCLSIQKGIQYVTVVCSDCSLISQKVRMNN